MRNLGVPQFAADRERMTVGLYRNRSASRSPNETGPLRGAVRIREEDLGSGDSFEHVHGALAESARPGSRLVQGRCLGCGWRLVEQKTAEWQQIFAGAVGQSAEVADAREASG